MTVESKIGLPFNVMLHLTETCNLRCKMCYFWGERGVHSTAASREKAKVLELDLIRDLVETLEPRKPMYSLFGGEPLMHPHIEDIIVAIKKAGSVIDTPTNGTLLEKHAEMIVRTGFDTIRVSLDGPKSANDLQRGEGSFDKAMAGIEALKREKRKANSRTPSIQILFTVTPENHLFVKEFFLEELDLDAIDIITIQVQNFLTKEMGEAYSELLRNRFGITSDVYWKGMVRPPEAFGEMDLPELVRQVEAVKKKFQELKKMVLVLPPSFSATNVSAYFKADWAGMTDQYRTCLVPWAAIDVTASGDIAPCHIYYDLTMGNLHEQTFDEIWNNEKYQLFREYLKEHGLMSICPGCCILYIAGIKGNWPPSIPGKEAGTI